MRVVAHVDQTLASGTVTQIKKLKTIFGLQNVKHNDDFASVLVSPLYAWQDTYSQDVNDDVVSTTQGFCDQLETVVVGKKVHYAGANGTGLASALVSYGQWISKWVASNLCPDSLPNELNDCLSTHNAQSDVYTNITIPNDDRAWWYQCCTVFGFFMTAPPADGPQPRIVPALQNAAYWQRMCPLYFPPGKLNAIPPKPQAVAINKKWGGWQIGSNSCIENLFWINGEFDPWRSASINSDYGAPGGGKRADTPSCPDTIMAGAEHGWDGDDDYDAPLSVRRVHAKVIAAIKRWLAVWATKKH
ncbi:unnamed protein product [Didymodactylos carnosus]|uniref:Uncharacterized protein n=1 Tax=Didymodactylos carnosus TaxID=1234261 RepID=A0A814XFT0_9BILA|nr:unnamed protein product [Didymodactylos carnosus]CAF1214471.1 unnamed protein product [Didymodactylos carnosus]CAF3787127.1 unnamed protein product [Didymodactylos carnosus]CAF3978349.1 unnamed protein product [Didymodactylos carnosus]